MVKETYFIFSDETYLPVTHMDFFLFADSAESLVKVTIEVQMILLYVLEIDSN
jgi:hypothetical protein